jgi:hypothetical protein
MARAQTNNRLGWGALVLGGVIAAVVMPRMYRPARRTLKSALGSRFTSDTAGPRPNADPARARPN